jgi:hypothetical protein
MPMAMTIRKLQVTYESSFSREKVVGVEGIVVEEEVG